VVINALAYNTTVFSLNAAAISASAFDIGIIVNHSLIMAAKARMVSCKDLPLGRLQPRLQILGEVGNFWQ
jgi:hypothetical protein